MYYCCYKTGEGWMVIAYNRLVVFGFTAESVKHKLSSKWEFLNDKQIRCRVTGQTFSYRIDYA